MSENLAARVQRHAEILASQDRVEEAFPLFVVALQKYPQLKSHMKHSFISVLCKLGRIHERNGDYEELFACYEQALRIFRETEDIQTNLGAHLFRLGYVTEASHYFREALQINSSCLRAKRNLENVYNALVERWHFRMLNDEHRNEAFREAIIKKIKYGHHTVLDIGTGSGILSLFAVEGGASLIYACDTSETMINLSQEIFANNNSRGKVKLLHKHSSEIRIPNDIPTRVSLVITETVDAALVGENILQTLIHAWKHLLVRHDADLPDRNVAKQLGHVIPCSGELWISAIECDYINFKYRLVQSQCVSNSDFLDFSSVKLFAYDEAPYDTLDLQSVPGGFRLLSDPLLCLPVDFNDCESMEKIFEGVYDEQMHFITCCESGRVDAFAIWFNLQLDEDITITSAPIISVNKAPCWDQAIFPLPVAVNVSSNEKLSVQIGSKQGALKVNMVPTPSPSQECTDIREIPYPVSPEMIAFLNDEDCHVALRDAYKHISPRCNMDSYNVLELSPFPVLGLTLLTKESSGLRPGRLMCCTQNERDQTAIRHVAEANGAVNFELEFMDSDDIEEKLDGTVLFDLVIINPVDPAGTLNEKHINLLPLISGVLKEGGDILPKQIGICAQLIHSSWLREVSQLLDNSKVCRYNIAPFINKYQVSEHLDACLEAISHQTLSEVIEVAVLTCDDLVHSLEEPFVIEKMTQPLCSGSISAIPFSFNVKYLPNCPEVSTRRSLSFAKQSVILLDPELEVQVEDDVCLTLVCHQGLSQITLRKRNEI